MKPVILMMALAAFDTWLASSLGMIALATLFASVYTVLAAYAARRLLG